MPEERPELIMGIGIYEEDGDLVCSTTGTLPDDVSQQDLAGLLHALAETVAQLPRHVPMHRSN